MDENIALTAEAAPTIQQISCPNVPLAVYREVAAHLRQVTGVDVVLLPQQSRTFDYQQSQIGGLRLEYTAEANATSKQRVQQILAYYGDRYGNWQPCE
jgi:hypothetical protein